MSDNHGLSFLNIAMLVGTITMLAVGQVLFKFAAVSINFSEPRTFVSMPLFIALGVYAVATFSWLAVLTRVPLSTAFPFYALGFILVPLLSVFILGEKFRFSMLVGGAIIVVGVIVSSRRW